MKLNKLGVSGKRGDTLNIHTLQRKEKSLKFLKSQLNYYQKSSVPKNKSLRKNDLESGEKEMKKNLSKQINQESSNGSKQLGSSKQMLDNQSIQKYRTLVDNLMLNIQIFRKVFSTYKKKRSLIEKLYGWDDLFRDVFFIDQEFKPNLKKDAIISELGLDKKGFASKNIYNKLRFFLAELVSTNFKQQQIECSAQRQKLSESCSKLVKNIDRLSYGPYESFTKRYIDNMKDTHSQILQMKMRVKNRGTELQKIVGKSGTVKLDPFYFKEEKNVHQIEQFLKESIKNEIFHN